MESEPRVIARLRRWPVSLVLAILLAGIALVLRSDLNGSGLRTGMYYRVFGLSIYPLFYGASAFVIVRMVQILRLANRYVAIDADQLTVGLTSIPLTAIQFVTAHPKALTIRVNGVEKRISTLALSEPASIIANAITANIRRL